MKIVIREYKENDLIEMIKIWNEIVEEGNAFPQEESLNFESGVSPFSEHTSTKVAVDIGSEKINGL